MLSWLVRFILFLSGMIAGLFIAEHDARFEIIKLVIAITLLVLAVTAAAFWKRRRPPQ